MLSIKNFFDTIKMYATLQFDMTLILRNTTLIQLS